MAGVNPWFAFFAGLGIGYILWGHPFGVTLSGGAFTTSPIASVYGYANDFAGCRNIAAAMNHAQAEKLLTDEFDQRWADSGNFTCGWH